MTIYSFWAPLYDLSRTPFSLLAPTVHRALDARLQRPRGRVLDLGCGTGYLAKRLFVLRSEPAGYTGVDSNRAMLSCCQRNLRRKDSFPNQTPTDVQLIHDDVDTAIDQLIDRGERFGLVVSSLLLAHLQAPAVTVRKSLRLVAPGGVAAFLFFASGGPLVLRTPVRSFLALLGAQPVDVEAVRSTVAEVDECSGRWTCSEVDSLGGCLRFVAFERA